MPNLDRKSDWTTVSFGDVVTHIKDRVQDVMECGLQEYVRGEHFEPGNLRLIGRSTLGDGKHGSAFCMRFRPGDVLYVSRNPQLRKAAVADFEGICANTTYVCRAKEEHLLQDLLPFIMQTESFVEYTIRNKRGSTNFYLNWSDIAGYEFALPPLEEQRRIAEVLTAAQEQAEALNELESAAVELRRSTIDSLLVGHSGGGIRRIEITNLPRGWTLLPASEIATAPVTSGVTPRNCSKDPDASCPFIKVGDLTFDGRLNYGPDGSKINRPSFEHTASLHVKPGDILTNIVGPPLGKVSVVPKEIPAALINQAIVRFRMPNEQMRAWCAAYLMSSWAKLWLFVRSKKTSGQRNINATTCAALPIPVPPPMELNSLVQELKNVEHAQSIVKQRHQESRKLIRHALKEVLSR